MAAIRRRIANVAGARLWIGCPPSCEKRDGEIMSDSNAVESILTLKRVYNVPVARLWRAWTDEAELGKWYVAGSDHVVHFCEADVRVGGAYRVGFGPPGATPYVETGRYTEVIALRRLGFEETVSFEDRRIHTHNTIVEF